MTKRNFWVIGGEFGSMNFHKLVEGSAQVQGPFNTRKAAGEPWRRGSEENRHKAGVRFSIVEEPSRVMARSSHCRVLGAMIRKRQALEIVPKDGRPHPVLPGGAV